MKRSVIKVIYSLFVIGVISSGANAQQIPKEKLDAILKNWKSFDASLIAKPENAQLLQAIRDRAKNSLEAQMILLDVGDPAYTAEFLKEFRKDQSNYNTAFLIRNPERILLFEADLNRDEKADGVVHDDVVIDPISVISALTIVHIVENSGAFPVEAVSRWRDYLAGKPPFTEAPNERKRRLVRIWLGLNKESLKAGDYKTVTFPVEP